MTTLMPAASPSTTSRTHVAAGVAEAVFVVALVAGLSGLWYVLAFGMPISLWGVPLDPPVMSLAQAVNIDFWLREAGPRALSQAQYYQPGLWFQFASYAVYRATGGAGTPEQLFEAAMRDPGAYWLVLQALPLALSFIGILLIWRQARGLHPLARCTAICSYFICFYALTFGTTLFFNESLTLVLAAVYFPLAVAVLSKDRHHPMWDAVLCGLAASALYLHKMNYIVWALALVPGLLASALVGRCSWKSAILRSVVLIAVMVAGVLILGYILLTPSGLRQMLEAHREIVLGSGIYGQGARTVISLQAVIANASDAWAGDKAALLFLGASVLLALGAFVKHIRDGLWIRENLPEAVLLFTAVCLTLLSILKHFQGYYLVAVAAVFPFLVIWLARAGFRSALALLLALVVYSASSNVPITLAQQQKWAADEKDILADNRVILSHALKPGDVRLWMYRIVDPIGQRLFLVSFTGLNSLLTNLAALQGPQFFLSPWHTSIETAKGFVDMKDIPWRAIVVSKDSLPWISTQLHQWVNDRAITRTELNKAILFERAAPAAR